MWKFPWRTRFVLVFFLVRLICLQTLFSFPILHYLKFWVYIMIKVHLSHNLENRCKIELLHYHHLSRENWRSNKTAFSSSSREVFSLHEETCCSNNAILSSNDGTKSTFGSTGGVFSIASGVACASPCNEAVSIDNSSVPASASVSVFGRDSLCDGAFRLAVSSVHENYEGSAPRHKITEDFFGKYASFFSLF